MQDIVGVSVRSYTYTTPISHLL